MSESRAGGPWRRRTVNRPKVRSTTQSPHRRAWIKAESDVQWPIRGWSTRARFKTCVVQRTSAAFDPAQHHHPGTDTASSDGRAVFGRVMP